MSLNCAKEKSTSSSSKFRATTKCARRFNENCNFPKRLKPYSLDLEVEGSNLAFLILFLKARLDLEQKRDAIKGKAIALEKDRNVALKMHEQDKKQVQTSCTKLYKSIRQLYFDPK